jgi:hypothetical protein
MMLKNLTWTKKWIIVFVYICFPIFNTYILININTAFPIVLNWFNDTITQWFALWSIFFIYLILNELLIASTKLLSKNSFGKLIAGIVVFASMFMSLVFILAYLLILKSNLLQIELSHYLLPFLFIVHGIYLLWRYLEVKKSKAE